MHSGTPASTIAAAATRVGDSCRAVGRRSRRVCTVRCSSEDHGHYVDRIVLPIRLSLTLAWHATEKPRAVLAARRVAAANRVDDDEHQERDERSDPECLHDVLRLL